MASSRADEVAEILWELKRADKISTYTLIARRAGFSPGVKGRTLMTCIRTVKRDWPHLHWWRAVQDDGVIEGESVADHVAKLRAAGYEVEQVDSEGSKFKIKELANHVFQWPVPVVQETVAIVVTSTDTEAETDSDSIDEESE